MLQNIDYMQIKAYYSEMGMRGITFDNIPDVLKSYLLGKRQDIIVSSNKVCRGLAKVRGMQSVAPDAIGEIAKQYFAMKDAFLLLAQKGVPVYFYNRIGFEKNDYPYSASARKRIKKKLSFPKMYNDIDRYEEELKEIFADKYSKEYVTQVGKIPQIIQKANVYCHEDCSSELINVTEGKRVTCFQPLKYKRVIHFYGRCGAFGYAVEDADTLPSQLQKVLIDSGNNDICVVNHGLWGGGNKYIDHNFLHDAVGMKETDIVVFYRKHYDKRLMEHFEKTGVWFKDITHKYHEQEEARYCFYDRPGHMNHIGYKIVAQLICEDLIKHKFECKKVDEGLFEKKSALYLNRYLKSEVNSEFQKELDEYIRKILNRYPLNGQIKTCGAIVMNCNPFTKGHKYLIELAAQKVDRLYIFIVEEDKSFFKFVDRFEMVKKGTQDLENVVILPSGRFIISSFTFPEYFMKDYVKEKNFDISMDLEIFCRYIAPALRITIRFAGEEPFDPVTRNYNENMRIKLPEYGMTFWEVPRLASEDTDVINATEVRRLLKRGDYDLVKKYVPQTTFDVLMEKYVEE